MGAVQNPTSLVAKFVERAMAMEESSKAMDQPMSEMTEHDLSGIEEWREYDIPG